MDFRPLLIFLLLSISSVAGQSFFSGAFARNIANVSTLIKSIVEIGDKETPNENLLFSKIIMAATEMPVDSEGSGERPSEKKPFIPLSEFQKHAAEYAESVAQLRATSELKMQLGEALRELRMENVRRKVTMDKFIEKFYGTLAAVNYNEFEKKMIEIEKNVIRFFTMKNASVDIDYNISSVVEELNDLLQENMIFDMIVKNNSYNDDTFITLFQHFRTHAIFLTVVSTVKEIQENKALLNKTRLFTEHVRKVDGYYIYILNSIIYANMRREKNGFSVETSFTSDEINGLTDTSNLPVPHNHNLFRFSWKTEEYENKYSFLTVRQCGNLGFSAGFLLQSRQHTYRNGCSISLFRSDKALAPERGASVAQILRKKAMELYENHVYDIKLAELLATHVAEHGLIVLYTACDKTTVSDNVYSDNHTFKVVVTVEGKYMTRNEDSSDYDWDHEVEKKAVIQIIGYFMTPKDSMY